MKKDIAISVQNLHKNFILPQQKNTTVKHVIVNILKRNKKITQKVLDGVSFDIEKGDFFGIVGRNGSGKSTLLKLISGIYSPTKGKIEINGGLTPFIELGVGFNPELSGRDNVYLNGALLGFKRKEMDHLYQDIVEFAELEPFMDQKLKNYSSGMQVRLAFSIAVKAKNDILIFDEVLAVGDEAFQHKCMEVFKEYRRNKQTVILVTHSMDSVRKYCTKALMLSGGKIYKIGNVQQVSEAYSKLNDETTESNETLNISKRLVNTKISLSGCKREYKNNEIMHINIKWKNTEEVKKIGVAVNGEFGEYIFGSNTGKAQLANGQINHSLKLNLGAGNYFLTIATFNSNGNIIEQIERAHIFKIIDEKNDEVGGLTRFTYDYQNNEQTL